VSKHPMWKPCVGYLVVLLLIGLSSGCGSGGSKTPTPIVITLTPSNAAVATGQTTQFSAAGDPAGVTWTVSGGGANGAGTIDNGGNFTAPAGASTTVTVTATSNTDMTKSASATVDVVAPGTIAATNNPQVALYTVSPAGAGNVSVQFGVDTSYGLTTWTQPVPGSGGAVSLYVAGMQASTQYHMRGVVQFSDGATFNDADQTFTTGPLPSGVLPTITATTTTGMTPQPGVELIDSVSFGSGGANAFVTDLAGNVLWLLRTSITSAPNPVKLLSNGHFLINFSGQPDGVNSIMEEVDLGNNVIWQMTAAQLNTALSTATCTGCNITIIGTHHDFVSLPNGHLIVLASTQQTLSDSTTATGDVVIDLGDMENVGGNNPNHTPQPVWIWNEFDFLDTNRRPYMYPDWTHSNALLYTSDGNLIVSMRHQNWLVKFNYSNGTGDGSILWHLGYQGDFALLDSSGSPDNTSTDWFFAQHGPSFTTTNTTGSFSMTLFDNGDDRGVTTVVGGTCGVTGQPDCYSTVPLLNLDETAMTATLAANPTTPDYSFFGGNAETLANGNVEFAECAAVGLAGNEGKIFEVPQSTPTQPAWEMDLNGQDVYRGFRIPSLYPGVQWSAAALSRKKSNRGVLESTPAAKSHTAAPR
jgi:arylsulfate sulfotransferase